VPPADGGAVEQLIAAGQLTPAKHVSSDSIPLEPTAGVALLGQTLLDGRANER
jgi:hypothetical protein